LSAEKSMAVLALESPAGDAGLSARGLEMARQASDLLRKRGHAVMDLAKVRKVFEEVHGLSGHDLGVLKERLAAAERAFSDFDPQKSVDILEILIGDLSTDPAFSAEKMTVLENARILAAARLVGLAGANETGRADSPQGQAALEHLKGALRSNAQLDLAPEKYPPKLRKLLQLARRQVNGEGVGDLFVQSDVQGAKVMVEGRSVGLTPLNLLGLLPRGRHRVWLEGFGRRSVQRWVEVGQKPARLRVELHFEGSLDSRGPGLRALEGLALPTPIAGRVADLLQVDELWLVGHSDSTGGLNTVHMARVERRTGKLLAAATGRDSNLPGLIDALEAGEISKGAGERAFPHRLQVPAHAASASVADVDTSAGVGDTTWIWWTVGGIASTVVVGATAFALALAFSGGEDTTPGQEGHLDVEVLP
jgi:hypothetical protein